MWWWLEDKGIFKRTPTWFYVSYGIISLVVICLFWSHGFGLPITDWLDQQIPGSPRFYYTWYRLIATLYLLLTISYLLSLPSMIRRLRQADKQEKDDG